MSKYSELDWCPVLKEMLSTGYSKSLSGNKIAIAGTSTLNNIATIRHLIQREKPKRTMEVGLAYGASALAFLATLSEVNRPGCYHHTAIDPYQKSAWNGSGLNTILAAGFSSVEFTLLEQDSALALPEMCRNKESYSLIYIDGSHLFEDVFVDFFFSARLLSVGGLLIFDDCYDKHVKKLVSFIDSNYRGILAREDAVRRKTLKQSIGHKLGIQQLVAYRKVSCPPREWNATFRGF
jgi:predicted O-methyltransferase YrrM